MLVSPTPFMDNTLSGDPNPGDENYHVVLTISGAALGNQVCG